MSRSRLLPRAITAAAAAVLTAVPTSAEACAVCFRLDDGPATAGVRAAVLVLVGVTGVVLAGFGVFAGRMVLRTRRASLGQQPDTDGAAPPKGRA